MSYSKPVPTVSFVSVIKGRDADVRVTDDGMYYAVDLLVVGAGKSRDYTGKV